MISNMPALSYHFGLSPTDVWAMTADVYGTYVSAVADINREMES